MPEQPDKYPPSEEDLDMVVEQATGKRLKPADLASGFESMRKRIAQLEADKIKLLDRMDEDSDEASNEHLAALNKAPRDCPRTAHSLRSTDGEAKLILIQ